MSYCEITLNRGLVTLVDCDDFEYLSQWKWKAMPRSGGIGFYALRCVWVPNGRPPVETIYLHRFLMGLSKGQRELVDHINQDTLDNRRANLRLANKKLNGANSKLPASNTSGYRGVSPKGLKWQAQIRSNGSPVHLGEFRTAEEAADVYNRHAIIEFGEFAQLNEIPK